MRPVRDTIGGMNDLPDAVTSPAGGPAGDASAPVNASDLPEHLAVPSQMPPTGPAVASAAIRAIGGQPETDAMVDAAGDLRIDMLSLHDAPAPEWCTWSTVGLHTMSNELPLESGESVSVPAELMTVGAPGSDVMGKVLGSCAFAVMRDNWLMAPGIVFGDVVALYDPQATTPHLMWVHPFTAGGLDRVDVGDGFFVHWLMGMPITDAERIWLETNGYDAFIAKLENGGVNYTDLRRDSLV